MPRIQYRNHSGKWCTYPHPFMGTEDFFRVWGYLVRFYGAVRRA